MTGAERLAKLRRRRLDAGLVRVEAWIPREHVEKARAYLKNLQSKKSAH